MKTSLRHLLALGALLAAAGAVPTLHAEDDSATTARVKFSNPSKPGTFKCTLPWAEVRVTGTDDSEIVVLSSLNQKGKAEVDSDGFRRLDEELSFELLERDNVVSLVISGDNPWAAHGTEFEIRVPRNTNLNLRTEAGGDIQVADVQGDIEIKSSNGEVQLENVSNASVETMNGEISATFSKAPTKAVSLTSMNGEIDLRLPSDTKANLRMRTHNGSIRTNFPEQLLQARTENAARTGARTPVAEAIHEAVAAAHEDQRAARDAAREAEATARAAARAAIASANSAPRGTPAPTPPTPPVAPRPPRVPHFGGKTVAGELNGGGVDIALTSMNGTITLRQYRRE